MGRSNALKFTDMKKYRYTVSSNNIWTSFDHGEVVALDLESAMAAAIKKLDEDFRKANMALRADDKTKHLEISFNHSEVEVTQIKHQVIIVPAAYEEFEAENLTFNQLKETDFESKDIFEFNSKEEMDAFIRGYQAGVGWGGNGMYKTREI